MLYPEFPQMRLRRLRQTSEIRTLVAPVIAPSLSRMIYPVFVIEGKNKVEPIASMPHQFRYSVDQLEGALAPLVNAGLAGVILFGVPSSERKDVSASYAYDSNGVVQQSIRVLRTAFPHLIVMTDVCVCAYMTHGHCGVLSDSGYVQNDVSLEILTRMALSHAESGAHCVAPSAMMDGQIKAIRSGLEANGFHETLLMAYATKFASAFYGPFRDAAGSAPGKGDRKSYQCDPSNANIGLLESLADAAEGADILMVKPALSYLDMIVRLRNETLLPIAAYNVSGEYSMICSCAEKGWGDAQALAHESLLSMHRAGADFIISYWANQPF